jgi:hypothetical protein
MEKLNTWDRGTLTREGEGKKQSPERDSPAKSRPGFTHKIAINPGTLLANG